MPQADKQERSNFTFKINRHFNENLVLLHYKQNLDRPSVMKLNSQLGIQNQVKSMTILIEFFNPLFLNYFDENLTCSKLTVFSNKGVFCK